MMSEALSIPAATVIALPTAAPAKVRQPEYHARWRARRHGARAGSVASFPGQYLSPETRRAVAEAQAKTAERDAIYAAGNLYRNGPFLLLSALWAAAPDSQRQHALDLLTVANATADPHAVAALTYAKALQGAVEARHEAAKVLRDPQAEIEA